MKRTYFPEPETEEPQKLALHGIGIPAEVLYHPILNMTEKILFGFLQSLSKSRKGCWATNKWLGGLIGVGPQTITNGVAKLRDLGYIFAQFEEGNAGRTIRRIFINPEYPIIYKEMVYNGNEIFVGNAFPSIKNILYPHIKTNIGGHIKDLIPPHYRSYSNINKDINNSIEDPKGSSSTTADQQSPISSNGKIVPSQFPTFWKMYPKKAGSTGQTKKYWQSLCNKKDRPTWDEIESAIKAQVKSEQWQDKQYIPNPSTWINQSRWLDDPSLMKGNYRKDTPLLKNQVRGTVIYPEAN